MHGVTYVFLKVWPRIYGKGGREGSMPSICLGQDLIVLGLLSLDNGNSEPPCLLVDAPSRLASALCHAHVGCLVSASGNHLISTLLCLIQIL